MAGQDFARIEAEGAPRRSARPALLPVLAIVLVALLCFAGGYWLGQAQSKQQREAMRDGVSEAEYLNLKARFEQQQAQLEKLGDELAKWKAIAKRDASSKLGELAFYKELPNQPVTPTPLRNDESRTDAAPPHTETDNTRPNSTPPAASGQEHGSRMLASIIEREMHRDHSPRHAKGSFRIQAGSFRKLNDAQTLAERLRAAGFENTIETVDLGAKGMWRRVYLGPFPNRQEAEKAANELRAKLKLAGLLIKRQE